MQNCFRQRRKNGSKNSLHSSATVVLLMIQKKAYRTTNTAPPRVVIAVFNIFSVEFTCTIQCTTLLQITYCFDPFWFTFLIPILKVIQKLPKIASIFWCILMGDITVWETTESKTIQDSEFVITNVRIRSVFFDTMGSRARAGDILSIMLFTLLVRVERKKLSNPDHFCAHVDRFD